VNESQKKIHLLDILIPIWKKRKAYLIGLMISLALSILLVLKTEKRYTVDVTFIPQLSSDQGGFDLGNNLGGIASLAGIDLGGGNTNDYPPLLYPKVMDKVDFQLELLSAPIYYKKIDDSISYRIYYEKYHKPDIWGVISEYTIGIPGKVIRSIQGDPEIVVDNHKQFLELSLDDYKLVKQLKGQVKIIPNLDDGYVTVTVSMPDKYLAAQLTNHIEDKLHKELVSFKTNKINQEIVFVKGRLDDKEAHFEELTKELASFKDSHKKLATESSKVNLESLQRKYDLAFSVYNQLVQQYENLKIQGSNNTPLITIIKPISIPIEKSSPNSIMMLIGLLIIGMSITTIVIFYWDIKRHLKSTFTT
jgi:capsular polysaccharide biosynthesis protein